MSYYSRFGRANGRVGQRSIGEKNIDNDRTSPFTNNSIVGRSRPKLLDNYSEDDDDDDDRDVVDDDDYNDQQRNYGVDFAMDLDNSNMETPKSFRGSRYSARKSSIKVPLKGDDVFTTKKVTTPGVMKTLTKHRTRNGSPLRPSSSEKEDPEDTLIKSQKLISDDNKFSPGNSPTLLFKSTKSPVINGSPIGNNNTYKEVKSPPSNYKVRPVDMAQFEPKNASNGGKKLFQNELERRLSPPSPPPPQNTNQDIEFDSSEDENLPVKKRSETVAKSSESVKKTSETVPKNSETVAKNSETVSKNSETVPQPIPETNSLAPQSEPFNLNGGNTFSNGASGAPSRQMSPPLKSPSAAPPMRSPSAAPPMRSEISNYLAKNPGNHWNDNYNVASSVEADSSSTNDKGSLQVGIPSRVDVEPAMGKSEILDKINATIDSLRQNDSRRVLFDDNNNIDLADISSDETPLELLNELESFAPTKSSPVKRRRSYSPQKRRSQSPGNIRSKTPDATKFKLPIVPPELTPIRKHYNRLSDKYSRHIMNKRQEEEEEQEHRHNYHHRQHQHSNHNMNKTWPTKTWIKLNKLVQSESLTVNDIINSKIVIEKLGCESKEDLKQRVEFLIRFNEFQKRKYQFRRERDLI